MVRLLICRTCPRYEPRGLSAAPTLGAELAALAKRRAAAQTDPVVRAVNCLAGCKNPCNAVVEDDGKPRLRFSRLTPEHLDDLFVAAARIGVMAADEFDAAMLPDSLRGRLSALSPAKIDD
ncbi:MAG: DUF1636 family protein [Alphaproteobacteria bacterium]